LVVAATAPQPRPAARTSSRQFLVTLHATVTKQWTYATSTKAAGCTSRVAGSGVRTISLRSSEASLITGSWPGGRARVSFSQPLRLLTGSITQAGTKTTQNTGAAPCSQETHQLQCARITRSFQNRSVRVISRHVHRLGFSRIKGLVPSDFFGSCPGEPSAVRAIAGGIELADSTYSERDLFDQATAAVTQQGSADVTNNFLNGTGTVLERVRWTLIFRRLGG
jgi:hypothetical protein